MRNLAFIATITGALVIAGSLLIVSFGHIKTFAESAGAGPRDAVIIAITVDALVVLALAAIGQARRLGHRPPLIAEVALVTGIVATTGANLHYGWSHGWMGIVVSLWVPVAAELSYQLAMTAIRMAGEGNTSSSVATGPDGRSVICGHDVPVAALAVTLVAVRRPAPRDPRPVICTRVVPVATVAATRPPRPRPVVAICGGHLISVATVVRPLADLRPVICGHVVAIADVPFPAPLADLRHEICVRPITPAEVIARTVVAAPDVPVATEKKTLPAPRKRTTATDAATTATTATREDAVLDWLTDPTAATDRMATATGEDVAELLATSGHGTVSARTGRRILKSARARAEADTMSTDTVAA